MLRRLVLASALSLGACASSPIETSMHVHYIEIVTPEVDATCNALQAVHGVEFGEPVAELGNSRLIHLEDGRMIGVRAPMHAEEQPVTRPYALVDDLEAAVAAVEASGAQIAVPPTEIPGWCRFALYFQGGAQYGLWQK